MKRTLILIVAAVFIAVLFSGSSESLKAEKTDTCCQKFQIISTGSVLKGCVISIVWPGYVLQCKPDNTGKCEICNIPAGVEYLVEARCDGNRYGSTRFKACSNDYVTIYVP